MFDDPALQFESASNGGGFPRCYSQCQIQLLIIMSRRDEWALTQHFLSGADCRNDVPAGWELAFLEDYTGEVWQPEEVIDCHSLSSDSMENHWDGPSESKWISDEEWAAVFHPLDDRMMTSTGLMILGRIWRMESDDDGLLYIAMQTECDRCSRHSSSLQKYRNNKNDSNNAPAVVVAYWIRAAQWNFGISILYA